MLDYIQVKYVKYEPKMFVLPPKDSINATMLTDSFVVEELDDSDL